jgi:hypothetical protein
MSQYTRSYTGLPRAKADEQAIADVKEYLTETQWNTMLVCFEEGWPLQAMDLMLGLAGVSGYPVHALFRRYALPAYREWMASEPDPMPTNEQGFPLERAND